MTHIRLSLRLGASVLIVGAPLAACTASEAPANQASADAAGNAAIPPTAPLPPATESPAPVPASPPADRTPVSEAPFTATSAQGAANVVQTYFALIEERKYADAARLWNDRGSADGMSAGEFAASFAQYRDYHAEVFAPGDTEGAAGSIYVDVPARIYGVRTSGAKFERRVTVSLRRVNGVDGATPEQLRWHIFQIADAPAK